MRGAESEPAQVLIKRSKNENSHEPYFMINFFKRVFHVSLLNAK